MAQALKWYSFRWKAFAVVLAPLVLVCAYGAWRLHLLTRELPMGTGPAGPSIPREAFGNLWSEEEVVLVGVGDSITAGYGAPTEGQYFNLLNKNDPNLHPGMPGCDLGSVLPNLTTCNLSGNFTVTKQHIEQQLPRLPTVGADARVIVVMTSGGNDLIHNYGRTPPEDGAIYGCTYEQAIVWTENIKERLKVILEGISGKYPGRVQIFLANIFDPTDGVSDPYIAGFPRWRDGSRVLELTNRKIAELCEEYENVHLVDVHAEFLGHGIHCTERWRKHYHKDDPTHWYAPNFEDPNPRGHDAVRRLFLSEMVNILPVWFSKGEGRR